MAKSKVQARFKKCNKHIFVKAKQSFLNIKNASKFKGAVFAVDFINYVEHIGF